MKRFLWRLLVIFGGGRGTPTPPAPTVPSVPGRWEVPETAGDWEVPETAGTWEFE